MRIGIIGAGNVGSALADNAADKGHNVFFGLRPGSATRTDHPVVALEGCAAGADLLILAVPFSAAVDALRASAPEGGQPVVDATNPIRTPVPTGFASGAEWIAASQPQAFVVKAFNVVGAEGMRNPRFGDHRVLLPVASDDEASRSTVLALGSEMGFEPVDAGPLSAAAIIESAAAYWVFLAMQTTLGRGFGLGALHR